MDKLLVAGVDTVLGANIAAWLAQRFQVVGLSWSDPLSIAGCETAVCEPAPSDAARKWIAAERPQWIVYCGPAKSSWDVPPAIPHPDCVQVAGAWAKAAGEFGCEFTLMSSDAVFTGPWMFHRESSECWCESSPARILRMTETEVVAVNPNALVIRTNVFGWSPLAQQPSLVETVLRAAEESQPLALDCMRYATPILATDLAEVLERVHQLKLRGIHHLAGGERINPFRFACLLADQFGLPLSSLDAIETAFEERRAAYGAGEASLQSRRIRKALEISLPMVRDGLGRLYEQHASGYRDRFGAAEPILAEKVA